MDTHCRDPSSWKWSQVLVFVLFLMFGGWCWHTAQMNKAQCGFQKQLSICLAQTKAQKCKKRVVPQQGWPRFKTKRYFKPQLRYKSNHISQRTKSNAPLSKPRVVSVGVVRPFVVANEHAGLGNTRYCSSLPNLSSLPQAMSLSSQEVPLASQAAVLPSQPMPPLSPAAPALPSSLTSPSSPAPSSSPTQLPEEPLLSDTEQSKGTSFQRKGSARFVFQVKKCASFIRQGVYNTLRRTKKNKKQQTQENTKQKPASTVRDAQRTIF